MTQQARTTTAETGPPLLPVEETEVRFLLFSAPHLGGKRWGYPPGSSLSDPKGVALRKTHQILIPKTLKIKAYSKAISFR